MSDSEQKPSPAVANLWSRLSFRRSNSKSSADGPTKEEKHKKLSAVEEQTENSRKRGTIWEAVRKADEADFKRLVKLDPSNVDKRGPVGECPVHMLFLYGSETHLNMARYLITHFPYTITQIYNQDVSNPVHARGARHTRVRVRRNTLEKSSCTSPLSSAIRPWLNGY